MDEVQRLSGRALHRSIFRRKMLLRKEILLGIVAISGLGLVGVILFGPSLRPEDDRHGRYAGALWPGAKFVSEPAFLYKDPARPLTWHVCTAKACGHYYEDPAEPSSPGKPR